MESGFAWVIAAVTADTVLLGLTQYRLRAKVSLVKFSGVVCGSYAAPIEAAEKYFAIDLGEQRWLALLDNPLAAAKSAEFSTHWLAHDLAAQIPWNGGGERFLPQMLGLERFDGLSLKKGCFPGQEVIARLHYKGELKRSLRLLSADHALLEGNFACADTTDEISIFQTNGALALAVLAKTVPAEFSILLGSSPVRCRPANIG